MTIFSTFSLLVKRLFLSRNSKHSKHTKADLKARCISHYERMIAWARGQEPSAPSDWHLMYELLGESPSAHFCPLCNHYDQDCYECPIGKQSLSFYCVGTPYEDMMIAENWEQWVVAAEKELEFLKGLEF